MGGPIRVSHQMLSTISPTIVILTAFQVIVTSRCLYVLPGHTSTIRCLKVLEGRPIAVSGSRDSTLRVWDIEQGLEKHVLHGHTHSVRAVEVHGNRAVSGSYDTTCRLWNVDTVSFDCECVGNT